MKMKIVTAIALGVIIVTAGLVGTETGAPQAVYAQSIETEQKIASRNEVNVSINGEAATKVVVYNIDGYNYFRVADICKALNMKVFRYTTDLDGVIVDGIKIVSNKPFDGTVENALSDKEITVIIKEINVIYDSGHATAKSFNIEGRNYIRLADIEVAANDDYNSNCLSVKNAAEKGMGQAITNRDTTINLKTSFDSKTNTIKIVKTKTDFQKLYTDLYTQKQGETPADYYKAEEIPKTVVVAQPELTQAPEVGTILAKILKDESKPAYIDGRVNTENYTTPYASTAVGDCIWYAKGRFEEVTGMEYPSTTVYDLQKAAQNDKLQAITDPNKIVARSIAVFGETHALFVEYVEHDSNGNPIYIYFTEANNGTNATYTPNEDGAVKKLDFQSFINRQSLYKGVIAVK